ncbi:DUF7281 domain-containing protein [Chitiniphilus eburneus]|uniref:DUF7281 domain-containing protein n=1 Tax=Chitiniphilus eburneus TaxID=2571148 RepID=A0A4U0PZW4_9NEIS|nr:hypothetical protein [Chitiniphilus eburneus]TJZ74221.1 hypothetical protein FAZ21_08005 [Chitiniphilus eburneus]
MISKATAISLLRVIQQPSRNEFDSSKVLKQFVEDSGIGVLSGRKIIFSESHKVRIRKWLIAEKVDPDASSDSWDHVSRSEALMLGPDEKWSGTGVRCDRISIKTFQGRPLMANGTSLLLPPGANLEWSTQQALTSLQHQDVVVVENWETFEVIDTLQVDLSRVSSNPLVLWRGGHGIASAGASVRFLEAYGRPVWSAPDYDPSGLAIASRLPHLTGVLAPHDEVLRSLLRQSRFHDRYTDQLASSIDSIGATTNSDIQRLWQLILEAENAVPQEWLHQHGHDKAPG